MDSDFFVLVAEWFLPLLPAPSTRMGKSGDRKSLAMVFRSYIRMNIYYSLYNTHFSNEMLGTSRAVLFFAL